VGADPLLGGTVEPTAAKYGDTAHTVSPLSRSISESLENARNLKRGNTRNRVTEKRVSSGVGNFPSSYYEEGREREGGGRWRHTMIPTCRSAVVLIFGQGP